MSDSESDSGISQSVKGSNTSVAGTSLDKEVKEEGSTGVISTSTFSSLGVNEELCTACTALGWTKATTIQAEALPLAIEGRDIIGLAETGSGKVRKEKKKARPALPLTLLLLLQQP